MKKRFLETKESYVYILSSFMRDSCRSSGCGLVGDSPMLSVICLREDGSEGIRDSNTDLNSDNECSVRKQLNERYSSYK
jgi:hypothetical protein